MTHPGVIREAFWACSKVRVVKFGVADFRDASKNPYPLGPDFPFLGDFGPVWVSFDHFLGLIFQFSLF
jgi:hypothetical protein